MNHGLFVCEDTERLGLHARFLHCVFTPGSHSSAQRGRVARSCRQLKLPPQVRQRHSQHARRSSTGQCVECFPRSGQSVPASRRKSSCHEQPQQGRSVWVHCSGAEGCAIAPLQHSQGATAQAKEGRAEQRRGHCSQGRRDLTSVSKPLNTSKVERCSSSKLGPALDSSSRLGCEWKQLAEQPLLALKELSAVPSSKAGVRRSFVGSQRKLACYSLGRQALAQTPVARHQGLPVTSCSS